VNVEQTAIEFLDFLLFSFGDFARACDGHVIHGVHRNLLTVLISHLVSRVYKNKN